MYVPLDTSIIAGLLTMSSKKRSIPKIPVDTSAMPYRVAVSGILVECETADDAVALIRLMADNDREGVVDETAATRN